MLNPVKGFQVGAVQVSPVFLFAEGRARFEEVYYGEDNGIQGLIGHSICPIIWLEVYAFFHLDNERVLRFLYCLRVLRPPDFDKEYR